MQLNISKSKELLDDFWRAKDPLKPAVVPGEEAEVVHRYKYLGRGHLNSRLEWVDNTVAL